MLTAADLAGVRPIRPLLHRPDYVAVEQPVLAADRVRYVGEPIAAVIAASAAEAEDLAEQVVVELEPEDAVVDVDAALAPDAPLVHPQAAGQRPGRGADRHRRGRGVRARRRGRRDRDPLAAPVRAAAGGAGAHAAFDAATGRVTLTASVQMPHMLRTGLADVLGIAEADLRVVAPDVGGAFGQKMALVPEYVVAVWAARHLRRAVAWIEDRSENLTASFHSRDHHYSCAGRSTPRRVCSRSMPISGATSGRTPAIR